MLIWLLYLGTLGLIACVKVYVKNHMSVLTTEFQLCPSAKEPFTYNGHANLKLAKKTSDKVIQHSSTALAFAGFAAKHVIEMTEPQQDMVCLYAVMTACLGYIYSTPDSRFLKITGSDAEAKGKQLKGEVMENTPFNRLRYNHKTSFPWSTDSHAQNYLHHEGKPFDVVLDFSAEVSDGLVLEGLTASYDFAIDNWFMLWRSGLFDTIVDALRADNDQLLLVNHGTKANVTGKGSYVLLRPQFVDTSNMRDENQADGTPYADTPRPDGPIDFLSVKFDMKYTPVTFKLPPVDRLIVYNGDKVKKLSAKLLEYSEYLSSNCYKQRMCETKGILKLSKDVSLDSLLVLDFILSGQDTNSDTFKKLLRSVPIGILFNDISFLLLHEHLKNHVKFKIIPLLSKRQLAQLKQGLPAGHPFKCFLNG